MKNTEDKKVQENMKSIPRNPNVPLQDEEIEEILKEAANKVDTIKTEDKKEPEKKENSESQKEQLKKEEKRDVVPDIPAFKKKDEKRENFDVKKESANQPETSVEKSVVLKETVSDKQQEKQIDKTNKDKKNPR